MSNPIYPTLSSLGLFDLKCGLDALTPDFDWKHVLKRMQNTAMCLKGFTIDGNSITAAVIKAHLVSTEMLAVSADSLLAPNKNRMFSSWSNCCMQSQLFPCQLLKTTLLPNLFAIPFAFLDGCTLVCSMPIWTPRCHSISSLFI